MTTGILLESDEYVAATLFATYKQKPFKFDRCLGLVDNATKELRGALLFHHYNGSNIELSYYGERTMTPGVIRCIARFIICTFDAARLTVTVSKRRRKFIMSLQRFGFKLEGVQRCYYGKRDCSRNTGVRLVLFRDSLDKLARFTPVVIKAVESC